jgi:hypothetical protein
MIIQIAIVKRNIIVLDTTEPITNTSLGNITLVVNCLIDDKTFNAELVLLAKYVYWIMPINR